MNGSGSGRYGWRGVVERRYRLHVRDYKTRGGFAPGAAGSLVWTREGGTAGSVGFTIAADRVVLRYTRLGEDAEGRAAEWPTTFPITYIATHCRFGGRRYFWLCGSCGKRREAVYLHSRGHLWACRVCLRLQYASQRLDPATRQNRRAEAIYDSLGGEHEDGMIYKPKRMRWTTFNRRMDKAEELSGAADAAWALRVAGLLDRLERA